MPRRRRFVQLALPGASPANDDGAGAGLDTFLGDARVVGSAPKPTASEVRARAGRTAQRCGSELEAWTEGLLKTAKDQRLLRYVKRVPVPTKRKRARGADGTWGWELVEAGKAAADFDGILPSGLPLVVECKSVDDTRLYFDAVQAQQVEQLEVAAEVGGVALLVVEFRGQPVKGVHVVPRQYAIPWREVPWQIAESAMGLVEAPCARWRVRMGGEFFERLRGR